MRITTSVGDKTKEKSKAAAFQLLRKAEHDFGMRMLQNYPRFQKKNISTVITSCHKSMTPVNNPGFHYNCCIHVIKL